MGLTGKLRRISCQKFLSIFICLLVSQMSYSTTHKRYYRYYGADGIANISSSVTSKHIRHGYDVLDQNMSFIQHVRPFNSETSIKQAHQRERNSKQYTADRQLKNAYTNSQIATAKKQESLKNIEKQIELQQQQLNGLYQDQISCKRQEQEYQRQNQTVPSAIKNRIHQNDVHIDEAKQGIIDLQTRYRKTQLEYDHIISRLKNMEK